MLRTAIDFCHYIQEVLVERGSTYDKSGEERSIVRTITAFNAITGHKLEEADGWLFLQLLKDARQWSAPRYHEDSAVDCIGYAALKAEALAREGMAHKPIYADYAAVPYDHEV